MLRARLALPILAALLPVFAWRTAIHCEASGHALGAQAGSTLSALERQFSSNVDSSDTTTLPSDDVGVEDEPVVDRVEDKAAPTEAGHSKKRNTRSPTGASRGVFIGGRTVLELAQRGVVPAWRWVAAAQGSASRPAGILLSRVSALGVGMADGDVLTAVEGRAVQTEAQIAGLVLAARARHDPNVSAVFWRGGVPWVLIVEMPYPQGSGATD